MSKFTDALARLRTIAESLNDDDPDKKEMLDVEGDYSGFMDWALRKRLDYLMQAKALGETIERYSHRQTSFENKADGMKDVIGLLLQAAGETKYTGTHGTVSVKSLPPKPIIQDADKIPDEYFKKSIDKAKINAAIKGGAQIQGVVMDNGGETLTFRI
jgi:hypothetical protein